MSWDRYCTLLSGLKEDTPLVQRVRIRLETDPEVIEKWPYAARMENYLWQQKRKETQMERMTEEQQLQSLKSLENFLSGIITTRKAEESGEKAEKEAE